MTVCSIFDLDGVLIDSRHAVRAAYERVGVTMPLQAWGRPWREWLIDACEGDENEARRVHNLKNEIYPEMVRRHARQLPLAGYIAALDEKSLPCWVITGASNDAAEAALNFLGLDLGLLNACELDTRAKERWIAEIAKHYTVGVYFDDQHVIVPRGWALVRVIPREFKV